MNGTHGKGATGCRERENRESCCMHEQTEGCEKSHTDSDGHGKGKGKCCGGRHGFRHGAGKKGCMEKSGEKEVELLKE